MCLYRAQAALVTETIARGRVAPKTPAPKGEPEGEEAEGEGGGDTDEAAGIVVPPYRRATHAEPNHVFSIMIAGRFLWNFPGNASLCASRR